VGPSFHCRFDCGPFPWNVTINWDPSFPFLQRCGKGMTSASYPKRAPLNKIMGHSYFVGLLLGE
jgi:hypothetical protein